MVWILGMPSVNPFLHDISKMSDQTLNRPSSCISQSTNCMSLDLLSQLPKHVNLSIRSIPLFHPLQKSNQPIGTLSARSTLPARLMSIKLRKSQNCFDRIDLSIHNNNSSRSESTLLLHQRIKVHQNIFTFFLRKQSDRRTSRDNSQKVIPTTLDSTCMSFNNLFQRNTHLFFNSTRIVYVSRNAKEFCSMVVFSTQRSEPGSSSSDDSWDYWNSLDIGDSRRTSVKTCVGRERWLESWLTRLAFQTLNQSRLFSTDVSTSSCLNINVKIVTRSTGIFTQ